MKKATSREPTYLPITWAGDIAVERCGQQLLVVGSLPRTGAELDRKQDPLLGYLESCKVKFGQKRTGKNSPHIRFANAESDEELIKFVQEFGPVSATQLEVLDPPENTNWNQSITAVQDLATLERERRTYAAALRLLSELKRGKKKSSALIIEQCVSEIVDGIWYWPEQWQTEQKQRGLNSYGEGAWHFDERIRDHLVLLSVEIGSSLPGKNGYGKQHRATLAFRPHDAGHHVLCGLINSFVSTVSYLGSPLESLSVGSLLFGIRPALYLILKREYLANGGTTICGNDRCRRFFVSERTGYKFCSPRCSRLHRQRVYWAKSGARKRRCRLKQQRRGGWRVSLR